MKMLKMVLCERIYRMMEMLDGERGIIRICPYPLAERIKLWALKHI